MKTMLILGVLVASLALADAPYAQTLTVPVNDREEGRPSGASGFDGRSSDHRGITRLPQQPLNHDVWDSVFKTLGYDYLLDNGYIMAIASDENNLYIGGAFEYFNGIRCYNVIRYDRQANLWSELGYGFNGTVYALAVKNGKLYAGGTFNAEGFNRTTQMASIAEWDGVSWKQLGGGTNGDVRALAVMDTDLFVGGYFSRTGSKDLSNIARWDGTNWNEVDGGLNYNVNCLLVSGDSLFAGGDFHDNDRNLRTVALYTDGAWDGLGSGINGEVYSLALFDDKLWAGGDILAAIEQPLYGLVQWDGSQWTLSATGSQPAFSNATVWALHASANLLYIGGSFSDVAGEKASGIAVYSPVNGFSPLSGGGVNGRVRAFAPFDNEIYVGGNFLKAGSLDVGHLAKLTHADVWSSVSPLAEAQGGYSETWVSTIAVSGNYVFIGGSFTTLENKPVNNIAMWNKATRTWSALGSGVDAEVWGITVHGGKVYVGGEFEHAGDSVARHIAYWDMTTQTWHPMGDGSRRYVDDIAADETGIYASVFFSFSGNAFNNFLGRWNGSQWQMIDEPIDGYVNTIVKSGDSLCIGGVLFEAGGVGVQGIALRTSSGWQPLGDGLNDRVTDILFANDDIYAGGWFGVSGIKTLNGIGRWDGATWNSLGGMNGGVRALAWRNGLLYVGGHFTEAGGVPANFLASWNGTNWSEVGGGTTYSVYDIAIDPASLYVGGGFSHVDDDFFSYRFAIRNFGSSAVEDEDVTASSLHNYPNPFADETRIAYTLERDGPVSIDLYNALGIKVRSLLDEKQLQGEHVVTVQLGDLPSGMYLCKLRTHSGTEAKWLQRLK